MSPAERLSDPITIGVVGAPHGVRGTVRVRPTALGRHLREDASPFLNGVRHRILNTRKTPKGVLVDFAGVTSREAAAALRGAEVILDRSELDEPAEDEFYVGDLVGLEVVDGAGVSVGVVAETFETPAHEVLVVRGGGGEILVPFTLEHVPDVDLEAGRLVVRPPEED